MVVPRQTLQAKGLKPVAAADKRTLARRAYFDLHGLPPSPADIEAFVSDAAPARPLVTPALPSAWSRSRARPS